MTCRKTSLHNTYRYILFELVTICLLLCVLKVQSQDLTKYEWKLARDKDSIQIYTRQIHDTRLKEFKARTVFNTRIEKIIWILQDVDNYDKWTVNAKNTSVLKRINKNEIYLYSELDLPWPFSKRDVINHVKVFWSQSGDTANLKINGVTNYIQEKKGFVRMPVSRGEWFIYQIDQEHVQIEYTYEFDPGGLIPAWIVNIYIVDGPYKTLQMMEDYIKNNNPL